MSLFMFSCGPVQLRCNYVVYNTVSWSIIQVRHVVSRVFPPKHWDVSLVVRRAACTSCRDGK